MPAAGKKKARHTRERVRARGINVDQIQRPVTAGKPKAPSLEKMRELWLLQVIADRRRLTCMAVCAAIAISTHVNRENRLAWPGIRRLAKLMDTHPASALAGVECLERCGHVEISRPRKGRERMANRYRPILKDAATLTRGSPQTLTPVSLQAITPVSLQTLTEPLTKPPKEPPKEPLSSKAAVGTAAVSKELRRLVAEKGIPPPTLTAECYRVGRQNFGGGSAALIGNAFQAGMSAGEVLEIIRDCARDRSELGHALGDWR
jgi:hypothetical protein